MYFYKLFAGGYEESYSTIYYSDKKYTQEEFEDIVFQLYKEFCQELIDKEPISLCYPNIHFDINDVLWDYHGDFKKKMEEKGFYELNKELTAYMFFDLTCDDFFTKIYKDVDDSYNKKIDKIFEELVIDESCWDNNCPLIDDEQEEKNYCKDSCMVFWRKAHKIKNRSCENCSQPYMSCDKENPCKYWHWDKKYEN